MHRNQLSVLMLLVLTQAKEVCLQKDVEERTTSLGPFTGSDSESAYRTGVNSCGTGPPLSAAADADFTYLNITWQPPEGTGNADCVANYTLGYAVYYYKRRAGKDSAEFVTTDAGSTSVLLKALQHGSVYCYFVKVNYSTGVLSNSEQRCLRTLGYGPDNPCRCQRLGTVIGHMTSCDPQTGQCTCKSKLYTGQNCDSCVELAYMNPKVGCLPCQCPLDRSNGKCFVNTDGVTMCHCYGNYGGRECDVCKNGFYDDRGLCVACNCSGNAELSSERWCDTKNGRCMACAYNTTGDHCERCLADHVGDPLNHTCIHQADAHKHSPQAAGIHLTKGSIIGIVVAVVLAILVALVVVFHQRCCSCRQRPLNFWTVELKDNHENVSFSGMLEQPDFHSMEASLLEDNRGMYMAADTTSKSRPPPAERPTSLPLGASYHSLRT